MDIGCAVLFVYFVYGIAIWKIENIGNSQKKKCFCRSPLLVILLPLTL